MSMIAYPSIQYPIQHTIDHVCGGEVASFSIGSLDCLWNQINPIHPPARQSRHLRHHQPPFVCCASFLFTPRISIIFIFILIFVVHSTAAWFSTRENTVLRFPLWLINWCFKTFIVLGGGDDQTGQLAQHVDNNNKWFIYNSRTTRRDVATYALINTCRYSHTLLHYS